MNYNTFKSAFALLIETVKSESQATDAANEPIDRSGRTPPRRREGEGMVLDSAIQYSEGTDVSTIRLGSAKNPITFRFDKTKNLEAILFGQEIFLRR